MGMWIPVVCKADECHEKEVSKGGRARHTSTYKLLIIYIEEGQYVDSEVLCSTGLEAKMTGILNEIV